MTNEEIVRRFAQKDLMIAELTAALETAEKYMIQNWRADAVGYRNTMASVRNAIAKTRGA